MINNIFFGVDHRAHHIKDELLDFIRSKGSEVKDFSNTSLDTEDDYVDIAIPVAEKTVTENGRGILICGSGEGMCIAANKVKGARAGLFVSEKQVSDGVRDDDINIACFGVDVTNVEQIKILIDKFLKERFLPTERFVRRINKIKKYENTSFYK